MMVWAMLAIDAIFGDPPGWHPVIGIGKVISWWERRLYGVRFQYLRGAVFAAAVLLTSMGAAFLVHAILSRVPFGWLLEAMLCGWFLAAKSLAAVVDKMRMRFDSEGLAGARRLIAEYVSRDVDLLTKEEILRATAETMAENIIDGVLAPIFFFLIGKALGSPLVGMVFYKAVNTMDSMVGYRNDRYHAFGMAAAKIDDAANWIPARLGALAMLVAGIFNTGSLSDGWRVMRRDRKCHSSPNSAYAEAAIAGLYRCRLGGDSRYFGEVHHRPWIGGEFDNPSWETLKQIQANIWISEVIFVLFFMGGWIIWG